MRSIIKTQDEMFCVLNDYYCDSDLANIFRQINNTSMIFENVNNVTVTCKSLMMHVKNEQIIINGFYINYLQ